MTTAAIELLPAIAYFGFMQPTLTEEACERVTEFVEAYRAAGQTEVSVTGHTDGGEADMNLSRLRAVAVRDLMVSLGVPAGQISVNAYVYERPAIATSAGAREPQNRRVEIIAGSGSGW